MQLADRLKKKTKVLAISIYGTEQEKKLIDSFFKNNPTLKKGETLKHWILEAIKQEDSHENRN